MVRRHARWALLVVLLALGWTVAVAAPAAATIVDSVTAVFKDECGILVVTVRNRIEASNYELGFQAAVPNVFRVGEEDTEVHRLRVADGDVVRFKGDGAPVTHIHEAPEGCGTADLETGFEASCVNALVEVVNVGPAPAADVRIVADGAVVAAAVTVAPGRSLSAVVPPKSPATAIHVQAQQRSDDARGTFFTLQEFDIVLDPQPCRKHAVTIEDTCTGVRIGVVFPAGPSPLEKLIVNADGPSREFDLPPPGRTLDVPVSVDLSVFVGFRFSDDTRVDAATHLHTRPASCAPSPTASPTAKPGGGLPVTGAPTVAAAGLGAGLLVLGLLALAVARRRTAR